MLVQPKGNIEEFRIEHGPRDLLARYFFEADKRARAAGVKLRLRHDFDHLVGVNRRHRDSWPELTPVFKPRYNRLDADNAFWIEGVDARGETVVTNAARLYDLGTRSLAEELTSLRIFFDDPAPHLSAGESVEVTAPSPFRITGRVVYAGGLWVRPDYRRHGFARLLPRLTRSYALTRWNPDRFWTMVELDLDEVGMTRVYGYLEGEERIATHLASWRGDLDYLFMAMGADRLLTNLVSMLSQIGTGVSRSMVMPMTN
jgi:GNAT superfamily N-acetyltransferase